MIILTLIIIYTYCKNKIETLEFSKILLLFSKFYITYQIGILPLRAIFKMHHMFILKFNI